MEYSEERPHSIFISAGEASGDLYGARLVRAIRAADPRASITCMGGGLLKEAGANVLVNNRDLAVVGITEVFRHIRAIHSAWRTIRSHLITNRPDIVVLIDFPDFNFLVARLAKRLGIRVFYYISPQVWAWRRGRVRSLKRLVDRMAVILPFEPPFYGRYGLIVEFVGHPLLDVFQAIGWESELLDCGIERLDTRQAERLDSESVRPRLVGLLPGSRLSEVRSLLPVLMEAAAIVSREFKGVEFVIPVAPTLDSRAIEKAVAHEKLPLRVVTGDTYGVIRACDLIITASGTVTLEAAIIGTPMIIVYKVSRLSYRVGRCLVRVSHIGLPNLIGGRSIAPELIQEDAHARRIADEALIYLNKPERLKEQRRNLSGIRKLLGKPGVAERVAGMVLEEASKNPQRVPRTAVFPRLST